MPNTVLGQKGWGRLGQGESLHCIEIFLAARGAVLGASRAISGGILGAMLGAILGATETQWVESRAVLAPRPPSSVLHAACCMLYARQSACCMHALCTPICIHANLYARQSACCMHANMPICMHANLHAVCTPICPGYPYGCTHGTQAGPQLAGQGPGWGGAKSFLAEH